MQTKKENGIDVAKHLVDVKHTLFFAPVAYFIYTLHVFLQVFQNLLFINASWHCAVTYPAINLFADDAFFTEHVEDKSGYLLEDRGPPVRLSRPIILSRIYEEPVR